MSGDGPGRAGVLARWTLGVSGAGVGLGSAARHSGFEESGRTWLANGLGEEVACYLGVFARRALGVGGARFIAKT